VFLSGQLFILPETMVLKYFVFELMKYLDLFKLIEN
jgi:hypothetical protein